MSWSTPMTFVAGQVLTAAQMNTNLRDNLNDLDRRTNAGEAFVLAAESTTSTSYTDLATAGPAVSATVGNNGACVVIITARFSPSSPGSAQAVMSYATSGASTLGAADSAAAWAVYESRLSVAEVQSGLNPGVNTFTAKYRTTNGGVSALFDTRHVIAIPLGR